MGNPTVSILRSDEVGVLDRVAPGVFDNPLDRGLVEEFLADPRHHLAVAVVSGEVVGFASAVHYVHPDKPSELWVNEIGVARPFRGKGIGSRLMRALLAHGESLGCSQAWVLADAHNSEARSFYRSLGGSESESVMCSFEIRKSTDA